MIDTGTIATLSRRVAKRLRKPPVGWVRFGSLRRTEPVSRLYGWDRGRPIDRYYIETFLAAAAVTVAAAALSALAVRRRLDSMDLISVLKTRE